MPESGKETILAECLIDFQHRRSRGEDPVVEDYRERAGDAYDELVDLLAAESALDDAVESDGSAPTPRPDSRDLTGATLGAYRILSELGSGGMGRVYLAEVTGRVPSLPPDSRVALKVIHRHLLESAGIFKRFLREAEIGRQVKHRNVVRTFDADAIILEGTSCHFLVMEYVEGQTLGRLHRELDRLPEELCRHIGREVAKGLSAIHEAGAVHRDIKPENVLITPDHEVKIMDLGVAHLADEAARLSQPGRFFGSPNYAAPEQFKSDGEALDGRTDLYALGLILYELASGRHPYRSGDFGQVMHRILSDPARPLSELNPQLSPFFEEAVHTLLEKDREKRFRSARELQQVLEKGERSAWWSRRAQEIRAETKRPLRRVRIPRETAVYGRDEELEKLRHLYRAAQQGDGQVVIIEGEAGIGKTRLVDELVGSLQREGEDLNFLFGTYPPGGAATASGAWSTAYREHFGEEGARPWISDMPALVPAFDSLLRGEPTPKDEEPLTKDSIQTVFVQATRALAAERPTIVLIEDLHFAPDEGRAIFAALAPAVPEHRVLLIGTTRPGIPDRWMANLDRLEHTGHLVLSRLGPKDLGRLMSDAFRSERLARELSYKVGTKSDGNPFFVFEIIRALREGKLIRRRPDGTWMTTRLIEDIEVPSSVRDLIQARISDLAEEEQEILDVASCCGFEFDPLLVGSVMGLADIPLLRKLGHLERSRRLLRSVGVRFVFDHHQVQEAIYGGLSELLRRRYHAALGCALEARHPEPDGAIAVELAEHFLRGERGDRALVHLDAALDHLEAGYLNDRAIDLADRALAEAGLFTGADRAELLLKKAQRLEILGRWDGEREVLQQAAALADGPESLLLRGRIQRRLAGYYWRVSRYPEAEEAVGEALRIAREAGDDRLEALAIGNLGSVLCSEGRFDEAREHFGRQIELAGRIGDARSAATATGNLGSVFRTLGRYDEALEYQERYLSLAREIGDRRGEAHAAGNLGIVLSSLGRYEEARERLEQHLSKAREIGDRRGEVAATGNLGSICLDQGRYAEARRHLTHYLGLARELSAPRGVVVASENLGQVSRAQGLLREAWEHGEEALAITRDIGFRVGEAYALMNRGTLLAELGALPEAQGTLEEAVELGREIRAREPEGAALMGLSEVAECRGDVEGAIRWAEEALALRREDGDRAGVAESQSVLGGLLVTAGREDEARDVLAEARDGAGEEGLPGPRVLAEAWLALLPDGEVSAVREALEVEGDRLRHRDRIATHHLIYRATGEVGELERARELLAHWRDHAPDEHRESMVANVPLNRAIDATRPA